jgi:hypothetical protein
MPGPSWNVTPGRSLDESLRQFVETYVDADELERLA